MTLRRTSVAIALMALAAGLALQARALVSESTDTHPVWGADWPKGLVDLVRDRPVVGHVEAWGSITLYYAGDTKALNGHLAELATVTGIERRVVLHAGRGHAGISSKQPYDWSLSVGPVRSAKTGEMGGRAAMVDVYLGGAVALEDLDVPLELEVRDGGEIEKFIAAHESKRKAAPKP